MIAKNPKKHKFLIILCSRADINFDNFKLMERLLLSIYHSRANLYSFSSIFFLSNLKLSNFDVAALLTVPVKHMGDELATWMEDRCTAAVESLSFELAGYHR